MSQIVNLKMNKAGWPPTVIEAIVEAGMVVCIRAIDVSGGEYQPYSWSLDRHRLKFLERVVADAVLRNGRVPSSGE